jgi:molecular chaperone GrpE
MSSSPKSSKAAPSQKAGQSPGPLALIEQDVRSLMVQLSEARSALRQSEMQGADAMKKLFLDLIEVLDAFERVFRNIHAKDDQVTPQMKTWIGNFTTVRRLLDKVFTEQGVTRIENIDQGFDPNWHRVSELIADPSKPEGTITEEVKAGYIWRGQVLRKAEVIVVGPQDTLQEKREEY